MPHFSSSHRSNRFKEGHLNFTEDSPKLKKGTAPSASSPTLKKATSNTTKPSPPSTVPKSASVLPAPKVSPTSKPPIVPPNKPVVPLLPASVLKTTVTHRSAPYPGTSPASSFSNLKAAKPAAPVAHRSTSAPHAVTPPASSAPPRHGTSPNLSAKATSASNPPRYQAELTEIQIQHANRTKALFEQAALNARRASGLDNPSFGQFDPHHHQHRTSPEPLLFGSTASAPPTTTVSSDSKSDTRNMAPCPVCQQLFPMAQIDSHLDYCLSERALNDIEEQEHAKEMQKEQDELEWALRESQKVNGDIDGVISRKSSALERLSSNDLSSLKKRPSSTPAELLLTTSAKRPAPPIEEDCVIIGVQPSKYFSERGDDDDSDEETFPRYKASSTPSRVPTNDAHHFGIYPRSESLNQLSSSVGSAAPSSPLQPVSSTKLPSTPLSPPPPAKSSAPPTPARPPINIPNSGGLFSERHFTADQDDKECPICFEEFKQNDIGIMLPCLCLYHLPCIQSWLERKPRNCPSHGDY